MPLKLLKKCTSLSKKECNASCDKAHDSYTSSSSWSRH